MLRSWRLVVVVLMVGAVFASLMAGCGSGSSTSSSSSAASGAPSGEPIKIGLDTALTGIVAAAGEGQSAVAQMFMDDVNASGGLLGRPIELVIEDSASDPKTSNEKAKILVSKGIDVAVGPALSAERTAAEPVFSAAGIPLLYSTWYEGGAYAPLMFIDAETPEQQVNPFVPWLVEKYGPNFYFVGSDYEFPRGQIAMAKKALEAAGGKVVGEEYVALGTTDFGSVITRIQKAQPDVLFDVTVGTDQVALAKQFYDYGLTKSIAFAGTCAPETNIQGIGSPASTGIIECFGYFQNIDTPENKAFVAKYKTYDSKNPVTTQSEHMYAALLLWQKAVEQAGTTEGTAVAKAMEGLSVDTPGGPMTMRAIDHHTAMHMYIAQVDSNGQFVILEDLGVIDPGVNQRTGE